MKMAEKPNNDLRGKYISCLKIQKKPHNKEVKLRIYALNKKFWINNKYIKTKKNYNSKKSCFYPFFYFI